MNSVVHKIQLRKRSRLFSEFDSGIATTCLSKSIYAVGSADVSCSKNLFVAASSDFTSLAFEEINEYKDMITLDIHVPTYDGGVKCCCFNDLSDTVAVSTGSHAVFLFDMQMHNDVQSFECGSVVSQLQHGFSTSSWLGCTGRTIFSFDPRDERALPLCSSINAFSLSPSKQLLAATSDTHICLYDPRQMSSPFYSIPFAFARDTVGLNWNADNCWITVNCGEQGVLQTDLSCNLPNLDMISFPKNSQYSRQNCFMNDMLIVGDDAGVLHYINKNDAVMHSLSVSDSPIISMVPLSDSQFLVTTDTESRLLEITPCLMTPHALIRQEDEEKADVVVMEEENHEGVETWMMQGAQSDYSRCSFDQFGSCRQQVFVCRTCRDQLDRYILMKRPDVSQQQLDHFYTVGYLCEECAHFCHANRGHDVVALGVKDNVTCDCGNKIFLQLDELNEENTRLHQCLLFPEKPDFNPNNVYSHNCRERWCYCDGVERLPMVQCVKCLDWFHDDCAEKVWSETHGGQKIDLNDESIDFVCKHCEANDITSVQANTSSASMGVISTDSQVGVKESNEVTEDAEDEEGLEELIRKKKKKNDRAGAMKVMLRYMLKKSLKQSRSNQRSIIVESDVDRAREELTRIIDRLHGSCCICCKQIIQSLMKEIH